MFGRRNTESTAPQAEGGNRESRGRSGSIVSDAIDLEIQTVIVLARPRLSTLLGMQQMSTASDGQIAGLAQKVVDDVAGEQGIDPEDARLRDAVTCLVNEVIGRLTRSGLPRQKGPVAETVASASRDDTGGRGKALSARVEEAKDVIRPLLMDQIDLNAAADFERGELAREISDLAARLLAEQQINLNSLEQRNLVTSLVNDMLGLGPLESLLGDEGVTDIMVNGPKQVYIEKGGKLQLTDIAFRDNAHVMNIATRIVSRIGRRVDESSPLCDARLEDGSRVNIIIPPLAIDGPTISIRKFSTRKITLDVMGKQNNMSHAMATVLKIASRARLNILVSGGTGSGKTTLLNALSQMIDTGERVVTIEDAAELQLQQPHVVRLETRPPNLEGSGEITQRHLVKNALRMRPDRIILGEIRGEEALDMLQAMNTGHDGSMGTIHANRPREALTRLDNMVAMAGTKLPPEAVRAQIAGAVNLIVQISRMRDGMRRITHITEIVGMEGEIVTTQDLFTFKFEGEDKEGNLIGRFESTGLRPAFAEKAAYFGLEKALIEAMSGKSVVQGDL